MSIPVTETNSASLLLKLIHGHGCGRLPGLFLSCQASIPVRGGRVMPARVGGQHWEGIPSIETRFKHNAIKNDFQLIYSPGIYVIWKWHNMCILTDIKCSCGTWTMTRGDSTRGPEVYSPSRTTTPIRIRTCVHNWLEVETWYHRLRVSQLSLDISTLYKHKGHFLNFLTGHISTCCLGAPSVCRGQHMKCHC